MCLVGIDRYRSNSVFSHPKTDEDIINLLLSVSYSSVPTFITLLPTKSSPPSNRAASLHRVILRRVRFTMSFPVPRLFPFFPLIGRLYHSCRVPWIRAGGGSYAHAQPIAPLPSRRRTSGSWFLFGLLETSLAYRALDVSFCMSIEASGYLA